MPTVVNSRRIMIELTLCRRYPDAPGFDVVYTIGREQEQTFWVGRHSRTLLETLTFALEVIEAAERRRGGDAAVAMTATGVAA